MSRLARLPINVLKGVEIKQSSKTLTVKGPKGTLSHVVGDSVEVTLNENLVSVKSSAKYLGKTNTMLGTTHKLISNMIHGVHTGFETKLQMVGVGYRAKSLGPTKIDLSVGKSHEIIFEAPQGITIEIPSQTEILIKGVDKQLVNQVAANIRKHRKPEPYKGKGIRYFGQKIALKVTKKK